MKTRIILFAAAALAVAACNKENEAINKPSEGTAFQEGQEVTIGVSSGMVSTKVTGTDDGEKINLVWEKGDNLLVTVGSKTANFVLSSGAGTAEAEFTGTMPASGEDFDIQYPVTTPDLSSQAYVEGWIPSGKLTFTAEGCTLDEPATLTATNSVLQLNLYGADMTVSKIVVTNISSSESPQPSYTLTCGTSGITVGANADNATAFFIVVPAGTYKFTTDVYNNAATPASIGSITTSKAQTFTAGIVKNMPSLKVATPGPVGGGLGDIGKTGGTW